MRPQYLILAEASVTESTVSAMDTMMTVLYLGCGFYCLLLWFRLRRGAPISAGKSILIPGGWQDKKCRHPQQYKQAIMPRVLILGAGLTLFGLLLTADHSLHGGTLVTLLLMALPLALLGWYAASMRKAAQKWW